MLRTRFIPAWLVLAILGFTAANTDAQSRFAPEDPSVEAPADLLSISPELSNPKYLAEAAAAAPEPARRWSAHVSGALGYKKLDSDWSPSEDQFQFGLADGDYSPPDWPFSFVAQVLWNYSDDIPGKSGFTGESTFTSAVNLGLRKIFLQKKSNFQPFVSGGLSIAGAWVGENDDNDIDDDSDAGLGWWASAGFYWNFVEHWHLGAQVEYSDVNVTLFNTDLNAGGWSFMLMVGYHW